MLNVDDKRGRLSIAIIVTIDNTRRPNVSAKTAYPTLDYSRIKGSDFAHLIVDAVKACKRYDPGSWGEWWIVFPKDL